MGEDTDILARSQWPALAQDLAVMAVPGTPLTSLDRLYSTYDITAEELAEILKIPQFQTFFKASLETFKAQGTRAGAMYRSATLAHSLSEKLYRDAVGNKMEHKDSIKLLELLYKTSGLLEKDTTTVNVQNNIALPLPYGLKNPKLNHMATPALEVEANGV